MLKVLGLVTFKIFPADMGGQKGVASFYQYLAEHHDIHLAVSADNAGGGKNVHRMLFSNRQMARNIWHFPSLRSYIKKNQIDIIIAEHSYPGWLGWLLSKSCRIPLVIHSHNIEAYRFRKMGRRSWRAYLAYEKWIHRQADHNFFISAEDQAFAISVFKLDPSRCSVATYGTDHSLPFAKRDPAHPPVLLFNGSLDYAPNQEAVQLLVNKIDPLLKQMLADYRVVITGKGASKELQALMESAPGIEYRGFVPDLQELFASASVFLNPVLNDTGIKTKVVEAIANHCPVVSTRSGATGMVKEVCGSQLKMTEDGDWQAFTEEVVATLKQAPSSTPEAFFRVYSWKAIAAEVARVIPGVADRYLRELSGYK